MNIIKQSVNPVKKTGLTLSTIFLFLIGTILFSLFIRNKIFITTVSVDTSKSIINTIMGVAGSFLGFFVLYLTISLESFKRIYGQYAIEIFRKDKLVVSVVCEFLFIILFGLIALIFADSNNWISILLFNLVCYFFTIIILLIVPYGNEILVQSSSKEVIKKLIFSLTENDFPKEPTRDFKNTESMYYLITENDSNKVNIITKILSHNISLNNTKICVNILTELSIKVEIIFDDKGIDTDEKRKVFLAYLNVLQTAFDKCDKKIDTTIIQVILLALKGCSLIIAKHHYDKEFIEKLFELTVRIVVELIESENESLIDDAFWAFYHMCDAQLCNNMPDEKDIWEISNDEFITVIDSKESRIKEDTFEAIDHATSFQLNVLVERAFLCKNHNIIENAVRMIGTFIEMIIFNKNLGAIQKYRVGSMLAYNASEVIKKFASNKYPNQYSYLSFYVGSSYIPDLLHENSRFSKSVFDYYIDIFRHLVESGNIHKFDSEKIGGLCRLIIANSNGINDVNSYVETIMKVQQKLKKKLFKEVMSKTFAENETEKMRLIASDINDDFKSYLEIMRSKNIINDSLKSTILKYI